MTATAADRWRDALEAWAIPEEITSRVQGSPWVLPVDVFGRRADHSLAQPSGVSYEVAAGALPPNGTVLDVGAGAGAASLPLARWAGATQIIAVDANESMLDAFRQRAAQVGVEVTTVLGRWPDVADQTPVADVVVCHHVFYNVPDLAEFALALDAHARTRVVVELPEAHPLRPLNPLWLRMHNLRRPDRPTVADAVAVLREAGIRPQLRVWPRPERPEYPSFDELVAVTAQRLCLPPERSEELAAALLELGVDPDHPRDLSPAGDNLVTVWWDPADTRTT
ncbi:MAG TPA: class I SAM-dependent methyltransferase [Micromonosporaceae bacterium]|nr:class I SAM-dependent methyltransferase [Micromonosporaceae bacterium]